MPLMPWAPGIFTVVYSVSRAWQRALWAAMVARVSPSCINTELIRLISSVFNPQAMVFANAVTAAVRLQAFISGHPLIQNMRAGGEEVRKTQTEQTISAVFFHLFDFPGACML